MNKYESPELKLAGAAETVVFGSLGGGSDLSSEYLPHVAEFVSDQEPPAIV